MKKEPDILSFDVWKQLWLPHEIENLDVDDSDTFDNAMKCPSCDGRGTIQLSHSFKNEHCQWDARL